MIDHVYVGHGLALKTYLKKIADPGDKAPAAAVGWKMNSIAAVFLAGLLGLLWLASPAAVFFLAAGMAGVSLTLAMMIPRHPEKGHETIFAHPVAAAAE